MVKKQTYFPRNLAPRDISLISAMGLDRPVGDGRYHPEWTAYREGKNWAWHQVCRHDSFSLVAGEGYQSNAQAVAYTRWEDYIKVNFFLSGRQTTVLDGFGQYEHERPEVFIISGPRDMIKIDIDNGGARNASIALCLLRDFFPAHLGLGVDELPEPLRTMALPQTDSYGVYRFPLSSHLLAATRGVLAAPPGVRRQAAYIQAKTVELMCLLIDQMSSRSAAAGAAVPTQDRRKSRLYEARELLSRRYAESLTLTQIAREVGLNRMALTSGFRQLFGMTVHDWLQKERMERAHALLQDDTCTVAQVAEAVGYSHSSTFSTAFHGYFGYAPHKLRGSGPAAGK